MSSENIETEVQKLRTVSDILDNQFEIPGTDYRVGIDPIIGLVPMLGDVLTALCSTYIISKGYMLGMPNDKTIKMVTNVIIDFGAGTIPFIGDIIDLGIKCNHANVNMIENEILDGAEIKEEGRAGKIVLSIFAGVFIVIAVIVIGGGLLFGYILSQFGIL